ncbi:abortive infection family protein [Agromyces mariniharenae]|uniref:Abortive infection family protein n=1 Tax=Agromyces mariniharenae TaxID=2604423 RepID=A0A5S4V200_9MICO|nr:abortive infection family protein [Agromyces mariniharenae]TYL53164.1 abortive infection family protein [Agromyces mariniharenae]
MDLIELGAVVADFFEDGKGPSHDQLDQAFRRTELSDGDPGPGGRARGGGPVGKVKRVRAVFVFATDHNPAGGLQLAKQLVALLRADGAFSASRESFAGDGKVLRLREAFDRLGFTLDSNGALRPKVIDNLAGTELTDALRSYVDRINLNPDDAPLQLGAGKDLDEAAARHVLEQMTGSYPVGGRGANFPYTLTQAFTVIGYAVPPVVDLDPDPHRAVQQCLFLLAVEANRLRNDAGTGHGRPSGPRRTQPLTPDEARLVARATALVAGALLDAL